MNFFNCTKLELSPDYRVGSLHQMGDYLLTPMRNGFFEGRCVRFHKEISDHFVADIAKKEVKGYKNCLWKIAAIITAPIALVGLLFKAIQPPEIQQSSLMYTTGVLKDEFFNDYFVALKRACSSGKVTFTYRVTVNSGVDPADVEVSRLKGLLGKHSMKMVPNSLEVKETSSHHENKKFQVKVKFSF